MKEFKLSLPTWSDVSKVVSVSVEAVTETAGALRDGARPSVHWTKKEDRPERKRSFIILTGDAARKYKDGDAG